MRRPTIVEFVQDGQLLGLKISEPQEVLLRAIYGLPLDSSQMDIFHLCTNRDQYVVGQGFDEVTAVCGARGGKDSRIACPVVLYESVYGGHEKFLSKGEHGMIVLCAQDGRATSIARDYIESYIMGSSLLSSMLDGEPLSQEIRLTNKMTVACFPSTKSSLRGWSVPAACLDECAFWRLEGAADSDVEIQTSIRRGMIGFPRTKLIKISTPYLRGGILWTDFQNYFGVDSADLLVWRASSQFMNPSLRASRLERERRLDPERFVREYEAEFIENLESYLAQAWIDQAVATGRFEIAPAPDRFYIVGIDPSGGSGQDAFTVSICHLEDDGRCVQDVCRGWKKQRAETMNLDAIVRDIATLMKSYGATSCYGDRYSAQWVVESFGKQGVSYLHPERITDKSIAYVEMEPLFAQGKIEILDHPQLQKELRLLEKRPRPGGKTVVDHPKGSHDDYANALALAAAIAVEGIGDFMPETAGSRTFGKNDDWGNEGDGDGHPMDAVIDRGRGRQFWN